MNPIRPDLPGPRHAATHPVSTTTARAAQAAFFQQALSAVKTAQETARHDEAASAAAPQAEPGEPLRRPGSFLDIRV